jgi:nicotinamide-nucleotide amidase
VLVTESGPGEGATEDLIGALTQRGLTVAVAESLTAGLVLAELTRVPTASAAVLGGVVAYTTDIKHSLLGVSATLLARHGPVHPEVAVQLAVRVRGICAIDGVGADIGVATTGVAGPAWQGGQPPGTVYVGLATRYKARSFALKLTGSRGEIRADTVCFVIGVLTDAVNSWGGE